MEFTDVVKRKVFDVRWKIPDKKKREYGRGRRVRGGGGGEYIFIINTETGLSTSIGLHAGLID